VGQSFVLTADVQGGALAVLSPPTGITCDTTGSLNQQNEPQLTCTGLAAGTYSLGVTWTPSSGPSSSATLGGVQVVGAVFAVSLQANIGLRHNVC
jgi:hypothetical protein